MDFKYITAGGYDTPNSRDLKLKMFESAVTRKAVEHDYVVVFIHWTNRNKRHSVILSEYGCTIK